MLQIQYSTTQSNELKAVSESAKQEIDLAQTDSTSEMSSDGGMHWNDSSGNESQPTKITEQQPTSDSYLKIKTHSVQCLATLFRICNKAFTLKGMWLLIFPSLLTSPLPHVVQSLESDEDCLFQVKNFVKTDLFSEPTLMQQALQQDENPKLRIQMIQALSTVLEHSEIIKRNLD